MQAQEILIIKVEYKDEYHELLYNLYHDMTLFYNEGVKAMNKALHEYKARQS